MIVVLSIDKKSPFVQRDLRALGSMVEVTVTGRGEYLEVSCSPKQLDTIKKMSSIRVVAGVLPKRAVA